MAEFKARLVDKDGNPLGTAANPLKISGGGSGDGTWNGYERPASVPLYLLRYNADGSAIEAVEPSAGSQVNADWTATTGVASVLNKPTIPAAQVNADWGASTGVASILNKPSTFTPSAHAASHISTGSDAIATAVAGGASGLMSGADKTKLDGLSNYSLPKASAATLGGIRVGSNLSIDGDGILSAQAGGVASTPYWISRSIEGVVYETTLMYWRAPAACTIDSCSMSLSSNPSATGSYCKVQVMKNGTLETNSIFTADTPMQITESTSASNGIYTASGTLDSNQTTLASGDVIQFRVNQADTGSADLLVQMKVTFT